MKTITDRRAILAALGATAAVSACGRGAVDGPASDVGLDLSALEARHAGGRIGFRLQGPSGDVGWRAEERFLYCSTFKLFLAAATLNRVDRGEERLDRAVPITAEDITPHAPATEPAVGSTLTIETLCQAAVEVSDNPAANILIRELGGLDAWRGWYRSIGDETTRVDRLETELNTPDGDKDTTTPAQVVRNLQRLFVGGGVGAHRDLLTQWLTDTPTGAGRIKAGVPAGWTVAHKTGTGEGPTGDIGLIWNADGGLMLVAAYYDAPEATTPEQRDAVIADAMRAGLGALGHG
ncbi:class A beta-lactamase [Brevundimonas sp.]|uniref:class A beta-lactamase n=1 Tax=Brevundimonas sp. TaxID=1871086 RepID=UPI0035B37706